MREVVFVCGARLVGSVAAADDKAVTSLAERATPPQLTILYEKTAGAWTAVQLHSSFGG